MFTNILTTSDKHNGSQLTGLKGMTNFTVRFLEVKVFAIISIICSNITKYTIQSSQQNNNCNNISYYTS